MKKWGPKDEGRVAMTDSLRLVPVTKVPGFKELVPYHRMVSVLPAAPGGRCKPSGSTRPMRPLPPGS